MAYSTMALYSNHCATLRSHLIYFVNNIDLLEEISSFSKPSTEEVAQSFVSAKEVEPVKELHNQVAATIPPKPKYRYVQLFVLEFFYYVDLYARQL